MKHPLTIILACLCAMQLQAQPEKLIGATSEKLIGTNWADGAEAYGCKWLADSLIQFYGESSRSEGHPINVQVLPDGRLAVTDKGFPPSTGFKYWMNYQGDTLVYKETEGHKYLVFFHKGGHVYDVWEAMRKGESLEHFDARNWILYCLAGTYQDSATHRKIVFQPDTPIVTGLANATHYRIGVSIYQLMEPLMIFDNGQLLYYEPNPVNWMDKMDIISAENYVGPPDSCWWDRGERIMTLQKTSWVNASGHPELPGRYSFGSTRLMTGAIMTGFSRAQWRLIRNEIFARYGYRFKSPDLIAYFSAQPWYTPRYDDVTDKLTEIERINVEMLGPNR